MNTLEDFQQWLKANSDALRVVRLRPMQERFVRAYFGIGKGGGKTSLLALLHQWGEDGEGPDFALWLSKMPRTRAERRVLPSPITLRPLQARAVVAFFAIPRCTGRTTAEYLLYRYERALRSAPKAPERAPEGQRTD